MIVPIDNYICRFLERDGSLNAAISTRGIGSFHVTRISLIITQVKNKLVYHSIY